MASGAVNGDYLEKLNPAQREAALHGRRTSDGFQSGPLLVIAGALILLTIRRRYVAQSA